MKTGIEGIAIASAILSLIWVIPKVQSVYQWAQSRRLADLFDSDTLFPGTNPLESQSTKPKSARINTVVTEQTSPDDFSTEGDAGTESDVDVAGSQSADLSPSNETQEDEAADSGDRPAKGLAIKDQEVWRFNLRAASLSDAEDSIQKMLIAPAGPLSEENVPSAFHAPGGIQFNLLLDLKWVSPLQAALRDYAQKNRRSTETTARVSSTSSGSGLVWFRNRSKTPLPSGKTRIIIWVSQY